MGISVAMCTYNGASYLQEQLDSIARQTRLPDELIICDDGSTDETVNLIERFARAAPFATQLIRNAANLGYSKNFANAVARCSHEIIALSDQDDIWYPNKLSYIERTLTLRPAIDGVFSNGDLIDSKSSPLGRTLWESFLFDTESQALFNSGGAVKVLLQRNVVTGMAFAFRSHVKGLFSSVPNGWIHDGWMAFLIATRCGLLAMPETLVAYRVHANQQVGAPISVSDKIRWIKTHGLGAYVRQSRRRNVDEYERTALEYTQLADYLRGEGRSQDQLLIAAVEAKVAHARRGVAALTSSRLRRWAMLALHFDEYETFAPDGLRRFTRDLML